MCATSSRVASARLENDVVFYRPAERDRGLLPHDPFKALIAPRPIGWISTRSPRGDVNLAPYSFFNAVADSPPIVMFSSSGWKDSIAFAEESGEFVWNLVTDRLRDAMNETSRSVERGVSEFGIAGLTEAESREVSAPRVQESPVALECRVAQVIRLADAAGNEIDRWMVTGEVVGIHLDESFVLPNGRVDTAGLRPLARAGYPDEYSVVTEMISLPRPD